MQWHVNLFLSDKYCFCHEPCVKLHVNAYMCGFVVGHVRLHTCILSQHLESSTSHWYEPCGLIYLVHSNIVYTHTYNNTHAHTNRDESEHLEVIPKVAAESVTQNHSVAHSQTLRVGSDLQSGTLGKCRQREGGCVFVWLHLCVYLRLPINAIHAPRAISRCVRRNTQLWLCFYEIVWMVSTHMSALEAV